MGCIDVHDMPEDGFAADLYERFGAERGFFGQPRSEPPGENHCLHDRWTSPSMGARLLLPLEGERVPSPHASSPDRRATSRFFWLGAAGWIMYRKSDRAVISRSIQIV